MVDLEALKRSAERTDNPVAVVSQRWLAELQAELGPVNVPVPREWLAILEGQLRTSRDSQALAG
jgi:hypothetical protein